MANYVIEYKQYGGSGYRFLMKPRLHDNSPYEYVTFKTLIDARKKCINLLKENRARLCVIRGGVEKLVYATVWDYYVYEDRDSGKWYMLKADGSLNGQINPSLISGEIIR